MQRIRNVPSQVTSGFESVRQLPTKTKTKIGNVATQTRDICFNFITWIISLSVLSSMSVMIYGAFYYGYIPSPLIHSPMIINFKPCHVSPGKCGSISADYYLPEVLMSDQPYVFSVRIDLPESAPNQHHGMFMSCIQIYGKDESLLREQCKSSLLPHRSFLVRQLRNLIFSPGTVFGYMKETEAIDIHYFNDYIDKDPYNPAQKIHFVIKSRFLEVYGAELLIGADFKGIRAFMYYYPITATIFGSMFYLSVFISVLVISWLRYGYEGEEDDIKTTFKIEELKNDIKAQLKLEAPSIECLGGSSNLDLQRKKL
uniref:Seipin n=1 Tax=Caligus clemensi TaxID=344056 RepID=C1C301_CALCM|nr:Seipin [Caligus clemensi]